MGLTRCSGMTGGLGASSLCVFRRWFDLAENKSITVANLFSLGLEQGRCGSGDVGCGRGRKICKRSVVLVYMAS